MLNTIEFLEELRRKRLVEPTVRSYEYSLKRFARYLEEKGIQDVREVTPKDIRSFMARFRDGRRQTRYSGDDPVSVRGKAMLELAYSGALRPRELRDLELSDIDRPSGILFIKQSKGGQNRSVPVGQAALDYVDRYIGSVRSRCLHAPEEQHVFISHSTKPRTPLEIRNRGSRGSSDSPTGPPHQPVFLSTNLTGYNYPEAARGVTRKNPTGGPRDSVLSARPSAGRIVSGLTCFPDPLVAFQGILQK